MRVARKTYQLGEAVAAFNFLLANEFICLGREGDLDLLQRLFREASPKTPRAPGPEEMHRMCAANLALLETAEDDAIRAFCFSHIAYFHWKLGAFDAAIAALDASVAANARLSEVPGGLLYPEIHHVQLLIHKFEILRERYPDEPERSVAPLLQALSRADTVLEELGEGVSPYFFALDILSLLALSYYMSTVPGEKARELVTLPLRAGSATRGMIAYLAGPGDAVANPPPAVRLERADAEWLAQTYAIADPHRPVPV